MRLCETGPKELQSDCKFSVLFRKHSERLAHTTLKMKTLAALLAFGAFAVIATPAHAQGQWGNSFTADEARDARNKGDVKSLSEIFRQLRKSHGGYQVDAELFNRNGRQVYIIDWVTDNGRRVQFTVDAKTGRILSSK